MLRAALAFFVFGILAYILGANNIAGISMDIGKFILCVFFGIALLVFLAFLFLVKKSRSAIIACLVPSSFLASFSVPVRTYAAESVQEKVEDKAGDATTKTKILKRKAKRKIRDATGNGSVSKDAKDAVQDTYDKSANGVRKQKRHLEHRMNEKDEKK